MERLTDEEFETIKKLALKTAQVTTMSQGSMYEAIKSLCLLLLDKKKLAAYEDIGTVEEFAAYKQAESEDCKICIWKNRHQKCACCKRNRHLKDCFAAHAAKEEQG